MKTVIAIASQKGGVGKTTTAVSLAHGLALRGRETLLVDLDSQGQVAIALGLNPAPGVFNTLVSEMAISTQITRTSRASLYLIAGDKRTATAQAVLVAEQRDMLSVAREAFVKPFNGRPEFVIFDTAPSVGGLQESAMFAADVVLIPAACDHLALFGVTGVLQTLATLRKRNWAGRVLVLPTFYDGVTKQSAEHLDALRANVQAHAVILDPIHRAVALRESATAGQTIFEHDPGSRAAAEYAALVFAILEGK